MEQTTELKLQLLGKWKWKRNCDAVADVTQLIVKLLLENTNPEKSQIELWNWNVQYGIVLKTWLRPNKFESLIDISLISFAATFKLSEFQDQYDAGCISSFENQDIIDYVPLIGCTIKSWIFNWIMKL